MKVSLIGYMPYRAFAADFEQHYESCVTTPWSLVEPDEVYGALRNGLDELMLGARLGFDGVAVTEHGQSSYDLSPNPSLLASALAYATESEGLDTAIYPVGRSIGKSREPLRVAEEMAMIDVISNGRLIAGFPVGLAYDASINNGVPPLEVRARFDEGLPLILRAWTEDEPFAFNGRFTKLRSVNIWPRPMQSPPPVWITGIGNPGTMQFTLENGFGFNYFGWFGVKLTGKRIFDRFWDIAEKAGQERNPWRVGMVQSVLVGDDAADAERSYREGVEYFFRKTFGAIHSERLALPGGIALPGLHAIMRDPGDFGLHDEMRTVTWEQLVESGSIIVGSAEEVADQLYEICKDLGVGHLFAMLQHGSMNSQLTEKNTTLFAEGVLPRLRGLWSDLDHPNHWWPESLGGTPSPDATPELLKVG